jgi:tetratricopeptide (TPR) repeat protein
LLKDRVNSAIAFSVFALSLVMYALTVQNTVPFWDSGEFIATSYVLGIPHPPGTPLYVLIGRLFTLVPIANIASRVNFMSSLAAAFAVLLTYLIIVKLINAMWRAGSKAERWVAYVGGVVGALFMAFSTSFWDSAVEAEVYDISSAMMLLCVWMGLLWRERLDEEKSDMPLLFIAYICFLAIGIHLGTLLALPPLVLFVLLVRWRSVINARFLTIAIALAVLGVSVHLYLLIRANLNPPINEADPSNWSALWKVLTRDQYKPPSIFDRRTAFSYQLDHMFLRYFWEQFKTGLPISGALLPVLIGVLGAVGQAVKDKKGFVLMLSLFLITSLALVVYLNFSDNEVRERDYFFIASYHLFCAWIGIGAAMIVKTAAFRVAEKVRGHTGWWMAWGGPAELASKPALILASAVMILLSLLPVIKGGQFYHHDRKNNFVARDYAYNMLVPLDQDSIILTNGDNDTFPLWYLQEVEGVRKDVRVVNLSLLNTAWYIKQLKYEEPKVPITLTDSQIDRLMPVRDATGRIILVKDFAVQNIISANKWKRPLYLAVTVPDQMGLENHLIMEGLSFRVVPEESEGTKVDVPVTLHNLYDVFKYDGLLDETRSFTPKPYKDDNTLNLVQNYCAAHVHCAQVLRREGKLAEALHELEAARAISPWYSGIIVSLGDLYEEMGALDKAESHYREMLEYHPRDPRVFYKLGVLLSKMDRNDEAVATLEEGIRYSPDVFYLRGGLFGTYKAMGEDAKARSVLEEWLSGHPNDTRVRDFLTQEAAAEDTT